MTYSTLETSASDGRPVELYTFSRGSAFVWRYTSADRDLLVGTQTYTSAIIRRGSIEQGAEISRSNLRLSVARDFPIASLYKIASPSENVHLVVQQYHYGDTDVKTLWQGDILGVKFAGTEADIELGPSSATALKRTGLRRCYQKQCPFALYGPDCTVDPAAFRVTGSVVTVSGLAVQVVEAASRADGYFDGGYLEWAVGAGTYERRFIVTHAGVNLTLDVQPVGLLVGASARLYPGCNHSLATCNSKFSNAANYGGMPYIPTKNPFGGDPVY